MADGRVNSICLFCAAFMMKKTKQQTHKTVSLRLILKKVSKIFCMFI